MCQIERVANFNLIISAFQLFGIVELISREINSKRIYILWLARIIEAFVIHRTSDPRHKNSKGARVNCIVVFETEKEVNN